MAPSGRLGNTSICTFRIDLHSDDSNHTKSSKSADSLEKEQSPTENNSKIFSLDTDHHQPSEPDLMSPLMYEKTSFIYGPRGIDDENNQIDTDEVGILYSPTILF